MGSLELTNHGALAARYGEVALNSRKKWQPLGLESKYLVHGRRRMPPTEEGGHADETIAYSRGMPRPMKKAGAC